MTLQFYAARLSAGVFQGRLAGHDVSEVRIKEVKKAVRERGKVYEPKEFGRHDISYG